MEPDRVVRRPRARGEQRMSKTTVTIPGGFRSRYRVAYARAIVNALRNHFHYITLVEALDGAWEWQHQGDWQRLCPHPAADEIDHTTFVACGICSKTLRYHHLPADIVGAHDPESIV